MPLFTRRERIAVMVVSALIVCGWIVRIAVLDSGSPDGVVLLRNAVEPPAGMAAYDAPVAEPSPAAPLDINTGTRDELEALPMIGATRAAAIVEYREKHGPFVIPEDIVRVPGIGQGIYTRIGDLITTSRDDSTRNK